MRNVSQYSPPSREEKLVAADLCEEYGFTEVAEFLRQREGLVRDRDVYGLLDRIQFSMDEMDAIWHGKATSLLVGRDVQQELMGMIYDRYDDMGAPLRLTNSTTLGPDPPEMRVFNLEVRLIPWMEGWVLI